MSLTPRQHSPGADADGGGGFFKGARSVTLIDRMPDHQTLELLRELVREVLDAQTAGRMDTFLWDDWKVRARKALGETNVYDDAELSRRQRLLTRS